MNVPIVIPVGGSMKYHEATFVGSVKALTISGLGFSPRAVGFRYGNIGGFVFWDADGNVVNSDSSVYNIASTTRNAGGCVINFASDVSGFTFNVSVIG